MNMCLSFAPGQVIVGTQNYEEAEAKKAETERDPVSNNGGQDRSFAGYHAKFQIRPASWFSTRDLAQKTLVERSEGSPAGDSDLELRRRGNSPSNELAANGRHRSSALSS